MKELLTLLAFVSMLAPAPADARDWRQGFSVQERGQRSSDGSGQYQRDRRDRNGERDNQRRRERLTDEERRELHRDLDRAHRELYRRKPSR